MDFIAGGTNARPETPMFLFKNADKNYPIRGRPDNIPGVTYRTGPEAWMDRGVVLEWVQENRVLTSLSNEKKQTLYLGNVNTHEVNEEVLPALKKGNTEVTCFPCNANYLFKSADSFLIQKSKTYWSDPRHSYKMKLLHDELSAYGSSGSGKLTISAKKHF